jgi:hypothetical protein
MFSNPFGVVNECTVTTAMILGNTSSIEKDLEHDLLPEMRRSFNFIDFIPRSNSHSWMIMGARYP